MSQLVLQNADAVYQAFKATVHELGGTWTPTLHENMDDWRKVAEIVIDIDADPVSFIKAQFEAVSGARKLRLRPRDMWDSKTRVVDVYHLRYKQLSPVNYRTMYAHLYAELKRAVKVRNRSRKEVLSDPYLSIPSWFRVALSSLDKDIINIYGDTAVYEYRTQKGLRNFIKECSHAELRSFSEWAEQYP